MRCINKKLFFVSFLCLATTSLVLTGCGKKAIELERPYELEQSGFLAEPVVYFADSFCVGDDKETGTEGLSSDLAEAAGIFSLTDLAIPCSKNIYEKLYPASTTKILTAYVALKYGDLNDMITVSENAGNPSADSSVCGIHPGDQLTLEQALYGLLLVSGNDAAVAIAENISGDVDSFAVLMNEEAKKLGATRSHFVNPHGLHDDEHYTCAYDLYLIFSAALENDEFMNIIQTSVYEAVYKDRDGLEIRQEWRSTDRFLTGDAEVPQGVTVYGGKTGTTSAAGNCLVLYSKNRAGKKVISIVLKANGMEALYQLMGELLDYS